MGTAMFSIGKYSKNKGSAAGTTMGEYVNGGAHTTTTSPSNLTDGAAGGGSAVTAVKGDVIRIKPDEDMRVNFGGVASSQTSGHIVAADMPNDFEIPASGAISITDIA